MFQIYHPCSLHVSVYILQFQLLLLLHYINFLFIIYYYFRGNCVPRHSVWGLIFLDSRILFIFFWPTFLIVLMIWFCSEKKKLKEKDEMQIFFLGIILFRVRLDRIHGKCMLFEFTPFTHFFFLLHYKFLSIRWEKENHIE